MAQFSLLLSFPTTSVSLLNPERVSERTLAKLELPYSSSAMTQRRLNNSQEWRWAAVGPPPLTGDPRQRALSTASAFTYLPNSRASLLVSVCVHVSAQMGVKYNEKKNCQCSFSINCSTKSQCLNVQCRPKLMFFCVFIFVFLL